MSEDEAPLPPKCRFQNPIKIESIKPRPRKVLNGQFACPLKYQKSEPPKTMPAPDWHKINKMASSSNNDDNNNANSWRPPMRHDDDVK